MKMEEAGEEGDISQSLGSPLPSTLPDEKMAPMEQLPKISLLTRPGFGTSGKHVSLRTNHISVSINNPDESFYQYSVSISSESNPVINNQVIGRKVTDKLYQTYSSELSGKRFAYDGQNSLYTVGPLPQNHLEFTVVLDEFVAIRSGNLSNNGSSGESSKRSKQSLLSRTYMVEISFTAKIPLKCISDALQGAEVSKGQDVLRVLDIVLRQHASERGCLLVRQSFFNDDARMFTDIGGGLTSVRGFYSSFRPTLAGLSLNMDASTTLILKPGPVEDFLLANQNVKESRNIDWRKARKMLKNMRVRATHSNMLYKIIGLSEKPCNQQLFLLKVRNGNSSGEDSETVEITVYEYFAKYHNIEVKRSAYMPCLDVGKQKRPIYLPLELCSLISLQRYKRALSTIQTISYIEKSRQKPSERIQVVTDAVKNCNYENDPLLLSCGISIEKHLSQVDGRVLDAPKLTVGDNDEFLPSNGRWNFTKKRFLKPIHIERWALVNFSARCDSSYLSRELINCGRKKGIEIERPYTIIEEDPQCRKASPFVRVEKMFEQIMDKIPGPPDFPLCQFLLCVLPDRKNSDIYGPWKFKCLSYWGIATQCLSPLKINEQYLTNLLLKINSKLGGTNSLLGIELSRHIPLISAKPTLILGMDVSHSSPGRSDCPSIAAVVGSLSWPLISKYRAAVRSQASKTEMIECLFKPLKNGKDDGIMRELLLDFYSTSGGRKPEQLIVFRDGVGESQFSQVVNVELDQMIKAYQYLGETNIPKFTVIIAQKNHHTRLFQASAPENVPPGTVVDTKIVHPMYYDFYMCAHRGLTGTSCPAHYHVLLDEIGFSPNKLQNLINSLCYVYQRSTSAISIVAPVRYAHLAALQVSQLVKLDDNSEASHEGSDPELPRLHENVAGSMFFC
ncbi:protein argonaute 16 [Andrographis paniculata]|uniref:protein argonaute 16 n=1 Tax=Andrographis paniculata TaxID=175694 RepID=UPI0021E878ED|nr:protein argonaute 16 [Andrographis paniculata]